MTNRDRETAGVILALASLGKIGPIKIKMMLAQARHPAEILGWDIGRLQSIPGIGAELADRIKNNLDLDYGNRVVEWAGEKGYQVITFADADYPAAAPGAVRSAAVFVRQGDPRNRRLSRRGHGRVAKCHEYGKTTAAQLAAELSRHGITVISGMAVGIDAACHRGALSAADARSPFWIGHRRHLPS